MISCIYSSLKADLNFIPHLVGPLLVFKSHFVDGSDESVG